MRKLWLFAFACVALAQEGAPDLTAVLCSRFDAHGVPVGRATEFFTDTAVLCYRIEARKAPAAGTKLTPALARGDGTFLGKAETIVADGTATAWTAGIPIAGAPWAQAGGEFRWVLVVNDATKPVLDLPFTVTVGKRWALLVGINDYPGDDSDLTGCDIDVANMRVLLQEYFFFPAAQITIVKDLDATRARIEKELTDLADRAGPTDAVVFYYSGHGTQVPDLDGDEEDGWDEGICPAEPRPKIVTNEDDMKLFLTDDRLAELLGRFKTKNVTVIFDCCHSGSGLRAGEEVPTLGIDRPRTREQKASKELVERAAEARANRSTPPATSLNMGLDANERWVFITGCTSWEMSQGNSQTGGRLTWNLVNAVSTSSGESWDQLMGRVREAANRENPGQTPTVEGAVRRYPFALAEADAEAAYVRPAYAIAGAIDAARAAPILRLPVGSAGKNEALVAGLSSVSREQKGVVCDVYPQFCVVGVGEPKGRVELTGDMLSTFVKDDTGRPVGEAPASVATILSGEVALGDRLLPRSTRVPQARPRVGVACTVLSNEQVDITVRTRIALMAQALEAKFRSDTSIDFPEKWVFGEVDYLVDPILAGDEIVARVFNRGGGFLAVFRGNEGDVVRKVADYVASRHTEFARLMRTHNPSAPFRLRASAEGGEGMRRPGEDMALRVQCGEPAYIYIWGANGETGRAKLLLDSAVPGSEAVLTCTIGSGPGSKGRFFVKAIAAKKPLDTKAIGAAADPTAEVLRQLQAAFPADGEGFVSTDGWADELVWFDFE
jgi:hypothetical protein